MDRIALEYAQKVRTIQSAIKTQNDILLNRISTVINKATLDAFEKLERNLKEFNDACLSVKPSNKDEPLLLHTLHQSFLNSHIVMYQENNLKNVLNQISMSISALQNNPQNAEPGSSLSDVLQLLVRAAELYSKNLAEILTFQSQPDGVSPIAAIQYHLNGTDVSLDDRIGTIAGPKQIAKVRLLRSDRIDCASIYDIHPIKNSHYMVVVTFENDLFLYDLKSSQVLKHLEPMRYAPATALVLQGLSTNEHTENTELRRLNLVAFGYAFNLNPNRGSEFDPSVYIYNISTGKRIQTLPGHERCVKYLIQLGDINTLVSGGRDNRLFFWNILKAEPLHIQHVPTMEIIDMQMNLYQHQIYCLSIDGKIVIIKLVYKEKGLQQEFDQAMISAIVDIAETTSLSQMLWLNNRLIVVCFQSGWLSGVNQIKILEERQNQNTLKFNKDQNIVLDDELYQMNTVNINQEKLLIVGVKKSTGIAVAYLYPELTEISIEGQVPVPQPGENGDAIRWNIKVVKLDGKFMLMKFGQEDQVSLYEIDYA